MVNKLWQSIVWIALIILHIMPSESTQTKYTCYHKNEFVDFYNQGWAGYYINGQGAYYLSKKKWCK